MRRIAVIALVIVAAVAVLALGTAAGGDEDVYEVRVLSSSLEDAYLEAVGGLAEPARELG